MNVLSPLLDAEWAERIGWTLVHSVWQVGGIAVVYAAASLVLRRHSANVRYVLGCLALVAMVVAPAATLLRASPSVSSLPSISLTPIQRNQVPMIAGVAPHATVPPPNVGDAFQPSAVKPAIEAHPAVWVEIISDMTRWRERLERVLPWLATIWLVGVMVLAMRPLWGLAVVRRLKTRGLAPLSTDLRKLAGQVMVRLRVSTTVQFAESALVKVPTVVGYLRPMVLLPASAVTGLCTEQLELILAHELAHVRRHDYLVNLVQTAIEALLFYHPGMWWVSAQVRRERENCCDDVAMSICGNRTQYIRALYTLESQRRLAVPALAASGGSLVARVRRLVSGPHVATGLDRTTAWLAGLLSLGIVALVLSLGQSLADEADVSAERIDDHSVAPAPTPVATGTLRGRILYDGAPPKPRKIDFSPANQPDDAGRISIWTDADRYRKLGLVDESLIVSDDGGIANVVVWACSKGVPVPTEWSGPLPPSVVRAKGGRFESHVLAFWNVEPLRWINDMDSGVNFDLKALFTGQNRVLRAGENVEIVVKRPEPMPARLTSNLQPWMSAYVLPLAHPYFAVTDRDGRFEIANLPLGEWEFAVWHERTGWLKTDRFPAGRFPWTIRPGENSLGDLRVEPSTLGEGTSPEVMAAETAAKEPPAIDRLDHEGFSQLHRAAMGGHVERVRELLAAGANVDVEQRTYHGTPLQYAASGGHGETVQTLIENQATIDAKDAAGRTPLLWAATNGHADVVRRLLDAGANVNAAANGGWTALHYAVDRGHVQTAQRLIDRGANLHAKNSQGKTPFELNPNLDLRVPWQALRAESEMPEYIPSTGSPAAASLSSAAQPAETAAPPRLTRFAGQVMGFVKNQPIFWRDLAPSPEWLAQRAEHQRKHGNTRGYETPDDYSLERLRERILRPLIDDFKKEHVAEPTEAEIEELIVHFRQAKIDRKREAAEDLARRKRQLEADRARLDSPDLPPQTRQSLAPMIARNQAQIAELEKLPASPVPEMDAEHERFFAQWYIGNWKLQQSLYKEYGGRAIFQQIGPEALDALRDLLKQREREGYFTINDPELHDRFWEYFVNDRMHVFVRDPDRVFEHPWSPLDNTNAAAGKN